MNSSYIFDTNIFNRILDGEINVGLIKARAELCATHIELNELQNTRDSERRQQLLEIFQACGPEQIPTESAVWDVSEWGSAKFTSKDNLYQPIVEALNEKNGGKDNNTHDALIAETAIRNALTLVTEDQDLAQVAAEHGGSVINLATFMQVIEPTG